MDSIGAARRDSPHVPMTDVEEPPVIRSVPRSYAVIFAAVAAAQVLDLATFLPAVARVGLGAESNPLARMLYEWNGPLGPAALKAAAIAIMLLALARVVLRFPAFALPSAALVVAIGLAGAASNVLFGLLA
jgi:hypothetical protein